VIGERESEKGARGKEDLREERNDRKGRIGMDKDRKKEEMGRVVRKEDRRKETEEDKGTEKNLE